MTVKTQRQKIPIVTKFIRYVAIDLETINLKPNRDGIIWMLSITEGRTTRLVHNCNGIWNLSHADIDMLEDETICKVIHNGLFDCAYLRIILGVHVRNVWCTQLTEVVIQGIRIPHSKKKIKPNSPAEKLLKAHSSALKFVMPRYGFKSPDKDITKNFIGRPLGKRFIVEEKEYAKDDTRDLLKIRNAQEYILRRDNLMEVALLEHKVLERCVEMKVHGIGFDEGIWQDIAKTNEREYMTRLKRLPYNVNNWNSPKQVKDYFVSTGVMIGSFKELNDVYLQTRNKTLGDFILLRELHKSITSYGMNWLGDYVNFQGKLCKGENFVDDDGRIRCGIDQIINTGRMSMMEPNLLQLPGEGNSDYIRTVVLKILYAYINNKRSKPQHRRAFIPRKGTKFVIGDFSGQEIGIMASMAGEDLFINAMLRGEDPHALVASLIQPEEWRAATKKGCTFPMKCKCPGHSDLRNPAKINNFMLAYGGGPQRLAANTGMSLQQARIYCNAHKRLLKATTYALQRNGRAAVETGYSYSADPYKRRRLCAGAEEWQVINQGKNTPIQSAGANMLKLAMISIPEEFYIPLVIHDEIILEVENRYVNHAEKMLKKVMEDSADYITGIKGLVKVKPRVSMNLMKED